MNDFDDSGFWSKVKKFGKMMGHEVLEKAFILYFVYVDPDTPVWAKIKIAAALAYLVSPVDAIPDFVPVVGFSDDLAVLAAAVGAVALHTKEIHKAMARERAESILGS
ncbi:MAG: DUF1232 domain-containing protein [Candidatus Sumerlaeia bacterium]|nr:DUF1232 domain-containing protein [Candidatus Sumerlaeia bacterium]